MLHSRDDDFISGFYVLTPVGLGNEVNTFSRITGEDNLAR